MTVFCDTSVLSALALTRKLDILPELFNRVTITKEVAQECLHPLAPSALQKLVERPPGWLEIVSARCPRHPKTATLDDGEASSISMSLESKPCLLLIDERAGRGIAEELDIPISGSVGLLGKAARRGLLDFEETVLTLRRTQFHLSDAVINIVRKYLLEPRFLRELPHDLVAFLKSDQRQIMHMPEGEVRKAEFLFLHELKLDWFEVDEDQCDDDGNSRSAQFLGFSLLHKAGAYNSWGVLLWLPEWQEFGAWDEDHHQMITFPGITWSQILKEPTWFISGQWHPDRVEHRVITPDDKRIS